MFYVELRKGTTGKLIALSELFAMLDGEPIGTIVNPELLNLPDYTTTKNTGLIEEDFVNLDQYMIAEKYGIDMWIPVKQKSEKTGRVWIFFAKASDLKIVKEIEQSAIWSEKYGRVHGSPEFDEDGNFCGYIYEP